MTFTASEILKNLTSKKFLVAVLSIVLFVVVFLSDGKITVEDLVNYVKQITTIYLLVQGVIDSIKVMKTPQ